MKLYVEEKDMPPNCAECKAEGHYENSYGDEYGFFCPFGYKAYTSGTRDTKRLDDCPLVPIPPHGRCIDVDALEDNNITYYAIPVLTNVTDAAIREAELVVRLKDIDAALTVIPASEDGENTDFWGEEYAEAKGLTEEGE